MEKYCDNCEEFITLDKKDNSNECPNCWEKLIEKVKDNDELDITSKEFVITKILRPNQEEE